MAEKVTDKLKRLATDLADSVRAELDLRDALCAVSEENTRLRKYIHAYVSERENVSSVDEAVSFVKGFYEAKASDNKKQLNLFGPNSD